MINKELSLNEIKKLQLEMLSKLDNFCKSNRIEYSLGYGTLIGAIRHGGYIPWDDDIDVIMTRPNYEKFLLLFGENVNDNMKVLSFENNFFSWVKIVDYRTEVVEKIGYDIKDYGVWIDVLPVDKFPAPNSIKMKIIFLISDLFKRLSQYRARNWSHFHNIKGGLLKKMSFIIVKIILAPFKLNFFGNFLNYVYKCFQHSNCSFAGNLCVYIRPNDIMAVNIFENYCGVTFEGVRTMMIVEYDKYLKNIYGDYMQLPPPEKRVSNHNYRAYWKNINKEE